MLQPTILFCYRSRHVKAKLLLNTVLSVKGRKLLSPDIFYPGFVFCFVILFRTYETCYVYQTYLVRYTVRISYYTSRSCVLYDFLMYLFEGWTKGDSRSLGGFWAVGWWFWSCGSLFIFWFRALIGPKGGKSLPRPGGQPGSNPEPLAEE